MRYFLTAVAFVALLVSLSVITMAQKEVILAKCAATFGEPLDKNLNLFPLDNDFVVRVDFNRKGKLKEVAIEPKYFFSDIHPEWLEPEKRPHLHSKSQQELVSLVDSIASLGTLKRKHSDGIITNSTNYRKECYENALVTFADTWDWDGNPKDPSKVRFIRADYTAKCESR